MPKVCVLISTFNRVQVLKRCLQCLELQTFKDFEVILLDDGSTDSTRIEVERYKEKAPYILHYLWQPNSGLAAGRNVTIRECNAEIAIQIGDDIFASPTFVEAHVRFHTENPDQNLVAIGLLEWSETGQRVTKLMRWLADEGIQFGFASLKNGRKPDWQDMYGSDISFKTKYFKANPYDETFKHYGFEDLELALRLKRQHGLKIQFLPQAIAYHLHPTDYMNSCRRMELVGLSAYYFKKKWPEFSEYPPLSPIKQQFVATLVRSGGLKIASHIADLLTRFWCPNPLTRRVLTLHGRAGYEKAAHEDHEEAGIATANTGC